MRVTVNEVSSYLCEMLTLIILKTYLQTGRRCYRITQRPVTTRRNLLKLPKMSLNVQKCIRFLHGAQVQLAFIRATSYLNVRLTVICVTVNKVSSNCCKIIRLIIVKTYLQTGEALSHHIARRPVVTCKGYFSLNDFYPWEACKGQNSKD